MIQVGGEQFTITEVAGTLFGIAGVWLTVKQNPRCFPTGIVNVTLYAWLFFQSRLYSDALLQVIYIILLIYGWYHWAYGIKNKRQVDITQTSRSTALTLLIIGVFSAVTIGTFFKYNTNASLPYVDSLTTTMSLIAQWMVARKKIENWIIWIAADMIYVGMYAYKHLYLTGLLYMIFIVLAIVGWMKWRKELAKNVSITTV